MPLGPPPPDAERCTRTVSDGGRMMGFHRCQNRAKPGTTRCGVHTKAEPIQASEGATPYVAGRAITTVYATLTWDNDDGPVMTPRYAERPGRVYRIAAKRRVEDDVVTLAISATRVLKDGTAGDQPVRFDYPMMSDLPQSLQNTILQTLRENTP